MKGFFILAVIFAFTVGKPIFGRGDKIGGNLIPASDVFKWDGCPDVKPSDFTQVKLVTFQDHMVRQPVHVYFNKTSDIPNFYFLERITGKVRYYVDATGEVQDVGSVKDVLHTGGREDGLNGIALDYDFDTTRWMYLFYSIKGFYRVARFKVSPDNKFSMETKQVIIDIPKNDGKWHASGKMDFDVYGDLWFSVGDNLEWDRASMATANLLGSWVRIHPTEEKQPDGRYYTIPKDNFGEYWAKQFEKEGRTELAGQYRDTEMVKPELFATGIRNSWGFKVVEPFRRIVASGDCGIDRATPDQLTEELNVGNTPGFYGWNIHAGVSTAPIMRVGATWDSMATKVTSDAIKGVRTLPPIVTPVYKWERWKGKSTCATGSDIYWYDGYSKSKKKFPPHFNGKLFATDHDMQWIRIVTLNKTLDTALSESEFFNPNTQIEYEKPLDVNFGPDGAMYVVHFIGSWFKDNPKQHISRIEYTGDCLPEEPKSPFRGCMDPNASNYDPRVKYGCPNNECCITTSVNRVDETTLFHIGALESRISVSLKTPGRHFFKIFDVNGELIASKGGQGMRQYSFPVTLGFYFIKVSIGDREYFKRVLVNSL